MEPDVEARQHLAAELGLPPTIRPFPATRRIGPDVEEPGPVDGGFTVGATELLLEVEPRLTRLVVQDTAREFGGVPVIVAVTRRLRVGRRRVGELVARDLLAKFIRPVKDGLKSDSCSLR